MLKFDFLKSIYPLILLSVAIAAFAQVALKAGMSSPSVQQAIEEGGLRASALLQISANPYIILGLFLYFSSAAVWLFVLARVQVSFAYPFVALGFILTALLGKFAFNDTFSVPKIVGSLLVVAGVLVMARSA